MQETATVVSGFTVTVHYNYDRQIISSSITGPGEGPDLHIDKITLNGHSIEHMLNDDQVQEIREEIGFNLDMRG